MSSQPRILIVDDDRQLAEMLKELMQREGYNVTHHANGHDALNALAESPAPDAIVLDVMMPGIDGFETLVRIRRHSSVPVIMLTARGDADDRIRGLETGASDYLAKPFKPRELLLRLANLLEPRADRQPDNAGGFTKLEIDKRRFRIIFDSTPLPLTNAEFGILQILVERAGDVASRDDIYRLALGREPSPYDRALDTHISNLRNKLANAGASLVIKSIRGKGYTLIDTEEQQ